MSDVDAIADGLLAGGKFQVIVNDTADNFLVGHDVFKVGIDEFAELFSDVSKVNANIGREIFERGQVAQFNELVDGKTFNHRAENIA